MAEFKVGITGASGFIGFHLRARLAREPGVEVVTVDDDGFDDLGQLSDLLRDCSVVIHLAGVNRGSEEEVWDGNIKLAKELVEALGSGPKTVIFSSSTQRETSSVYGKAKMEAEGVLTEWAKRSGGQALVLVIPNVFGPGCQPFYNSVVATFCYLVARGELPEIHVDREMELIHVDDLCDEIANHILDSNHWDLGIVEVLSRYSATVSGVLTSLQGFADQLFGDGVLPVPNSPFEEDLLSTFMAYLPDERRKGSPTVHSDERGWLFELVRLQQGGQVFFSATKPGVTRGGHYHTRKFERFFVIQGDAKIRMRSLMSGEVKEFEVFGSPGYVEIPPFHTHDITNIGSEDLLVVFWANELFDPDCPDTVYAPVEIPPDAESRQ